MTNEFEYQLGIADACMLKTPQETNATYRKGYLSEIDRILTSDKLGRLERKKIETLRNSALKKES